MNSILTYEKLNEVIRTICYDMLMHIATEAEDEYKKYGGDVSFRAENYYISNRDKFTLVPALQKHFRRAFDDSMIIDNTSNGNTRASWNSTSKTLYMNPKFYKLQLASFVNIYLWFNSLKINETDEIVLPKKTPFTIQHDIISTMIHELQHVEQTPYNTKNYNPPISGINRLSNKVFDSGYAVSGDKTASYAMHAILPTELQAIANECIAEYLNESDWNNVGTQYNDIELKEAKFESPSAVISAVMAKLARKNIFNDSKQNTIFKIDGNNKLESDIMKRLYKYVAAAVNAWWNDKTTIGKEAIEELLIAHQKGKETRLSKFKKNTKFSQRVATVALTKSDIQLATQNYIENPITEDNISSVNVDFSKLDIKTDEDRNSILLLMVQKILEAKLGHTFTVIDGELTKFELPTITVKLQKYNRALYNIYLSPIQDTIFDYSENPRSKVDNLKFILINNPQIFENMTHVVLETFVAYTGLSKNLQTRLKNSKHLRLMTSEEIKQALSGLTKDKTLADAWRIALNVILKKAAEFMRTDIEWVYNPSVTGANIYNSTGQMRVEYDASFVDSLKNQNAGYRNLSGKIKDLVGLDFSLKVMPSMLETKKSKFYPILGAIFSTLNSTIQPPAHAEDISHPSESSEEATVELNSKQLSSLRKILKEVGLSSLAKIKDQHELQVALRNMKQDYKTSILANMSVDEKFKNILVAFMYT